MTKKYSDVEGQAKRSSGFQLKTVTWLAMTAGFGLVLLFSAGSSTGPQFLSRIGASIALGLAAWMLGGLLGFLFGIPRTLQQDISSPDPNRERGEITYQINTNLEQISDWLTKIIVGVGLVQLGSIGKWLTGFSVQIGEGFLPGSAIAYAYILGAIIYFLTSGFLLGYLWTRLFFGVAIRQADQGLVGRLEKWERNARNDAKALSLVTRQLNRSAGEAAVSEEDLKVAIANATKLTKTRIFYDAVAARRSDDRRAASIPVFQALIASDTEKVFHRNQAELAFAYKDKAAPNWPEAEKLLSEAIEIRDRLEEDDWYEYEFNRAICRIQLGRTVDEVVADFKKAAGDERVAKWPLKRWSSWLSANQLTAQDLGYRS